jgi:hypothetical protein
MRDDPNLAAAALELGPIGFVLKHSTGTELLNAIEHVPSGSTEWLNTFNIVICHWRLTRSFSGTVLISEKLPRFVIASRRLLRAALPYELLNTVWASAPLTIK